MKKTLFKNNEPFSKHTTLKIGGPMRKYLEVFQEEDLIALVKNLVAKSEGFLVIGDGSNLLVSDQGLDGVVVRNSVTGIMKEGKSIEVKSGTRLQDLVDFANNSGLSGLQKIAGIPGSVGGAIYGNAGAYGQTISDHLKRVKVFDGRRIFWKDKNDCLFEYRESVFKKRKDLIILEAEFELLQGDPLKLGREAKNIIELRLEKYRPGLLCPGSFFKNIVVETLSTDQIARIPKEKIVYGKVPAGYLLEAVGAKGAQLGKIKIADHHANLFVNLGGGTAKDFYHLAETYRKKVKDKFGIDLEPEVQLVGF